MSDSVIKELEFSANLLSGLEEKYGKDSALFAINYLTTNALLYIWGNNYGCSGSQHSYAKEAEEVLGSRLDWDRIAIDEAFEALMVSLGL